MKLHDLFPSIYLKKEDVPQPIVATVRQITQEQIDGEHGKELKAVAHFTGAMKPMILNKSNATTLAETFGDDSVAWHGKQVEIYVDMSVMYQGKRVGGLKLRIPAPGTLPSSIPGQPAPVPAPPANGAAASGDLWDVSDGQSTFFRQTRQQVDAMLQQVPVTQLKVKPSGSGRDQAKPADQWGFVGGNVSDEIPF